MPHDYLLGLPEARRRLEQYVMQARTPDERWPQQEALDPEFLHRLVSDVIQATRQEIPPF